MLEQEHTNLHGALQWLDGRAEQGNVDAVVIRIYLKSANRA
jgi:hypothetical protein